MATAAAVGTVPAWIKFINGDSMQAVIMVIGMILSVSIIAVNAQSFWARRRLNKLNTKIKEQQARDLGIDPDDI